MTHGRLGWIALAVSGMAHVALLAWNPDLGYRPSRASHDRSAPLLLEPAFAPAPRPLRRPPPKRRLDPSDRTPTTTARLARVALRVAPVDRLDAVAPGGTELPAVDPPEGPTLPVLIHAPDPPYPPAARRGRIEGTVLLAVLVDERGRVADCRIARSSGHRPLDAAALETARERWRFRPATRGREEVPRWVRIPVRFHLRSTR